MGGRGGLGEEEGIGLVWLWVGGYVDGCWRHHAQGWLGLLESRPASPSWTPPSLPLSWPQRASTSTPDPTPETTAAAHNEVPWPRLAAQDGQRVVRGALGGRGGHVVQVQRAMQLGGHLLRKSSVWGVAVCVCGCGRLLGWVGVSTQGEWDLGNRAAAIHAVRQSW